MLIQILLLLFLILLNAFFAASEIALISLSDVKIRQLTRSGGVKGKLLEKLLADPGKFLATIQIGITLAGFLASASASESFADPLVVILTNAGVPLSGSILKTLVVLVITLFLSYFTLVLGELVPKRLAMQRAESIAMFAVRPLHVLSRIASPFVRLLTASTDAIVRLFGVDPTAHAEEATEEEIRMLADVGQEKGTIDADEKAMIHNIFEFDDKVVSLVMTHRTDMVALDIGTPLQALLAVVTTEQYSRIPVYRKDSDHITGILHVKDLLPMLLDLPDAADTPPFDLQLLLRPPFRVPESKPVNDLLRDMKKNRVHMAVVMDEYGGTAGIVTIEDLLEELVGEIDDEYDQATSRIESVDAQTWLVSGQASLAEVARTLGLSLPTDSFSTVAGYVINQLGRIPAPGEKVAIVVDGVRYSGIALQGRHMLRIETLRIQVPERNPPGPKRN